MGKPCGWRALEKLPVKWFCINSAGCRKFYCNVCWPFAYAVATAKAQRLFNITSNYRANPSENNRYLL